MKSASLWIIFFWLSGKIAAFALPPEPTVVDSQQKPPGYAVASEHPLATQAGIKILAEGGNAFDAAIAVSAVLGVVAPYHSGLGGGGLWLLYEAKTRKNSVLDARETAPKAAYANMFLDEKGKIRPGLSLNGGLAAAIPGQPAALVYLAEHYGRLPLQQSLAPAIELAENGFLVDQAFYDFSKMSDRLQQMQRFPGTKAVFTQQGQAYPVGARLYQKDLAQTLRLLAHQGRAGFYEGLIAQKLVQGVNAAGGIWKLADLAAYQVKIREPLYGAFHNMLIITVPPPSAGGIGLLTMLNILSAYPLAELPKAAWVHHLAEAMRLTYWQRTRYLGDPDFVKLPIDWLISMQNANELRKKMVPNRATSNQTLLENTAQFSPKKSVYTTHIVILDTDGNRVSATMTVNYIFGSSVIAPGTGVLLNDEMDDFSTEIGQANVFGLPGSAANAIAPGKRPLSSMTPVFLEMPGRLALFGTPGGSRIPTMTLLAALSFFDYQGAISMVSRMRFHHQYRPDVLAFEPETFSPNLQKALAAMGYALMPLKQYYGNMQAITWDKSNHILTAASDPRQTGLATVIHIENNVQGYGVTH